MRKTKFTFPLFVMLLFACGKEDNQMQYPKTFNFNHSDLSSESGFVIGDNESFNKIDSKAGNLTVLRSQVTDDLYFYIRKLGYGTYIESIDIIKKDSIQINAWVNGSVQSNILVANLDNINGEVIDKNLYGYTIVWDKIKEELKICLTVSIGILERNGKSSAEIDYDFCQSKDPTSELQSVLMNSNYIKNDTIGIYLLDMIYK